MVEKNGFHYGYFQAFSDMVYGSTLNTEHMIDAGKLHHQEKFIRINDDGSTDFVEPDVPENAWYVKMVKGNEYYLVPKRYIEEFPIRVKSTREVKLKGSDTQVWKLVTSASSFAIPVPDTPPSSLKSFASRWNPVSHENESAWVLLKLISFCRGLKLGVCAPYAAGKNANLQIRRYLDRKTLPKVKASSKAMIYRELYFNDFVNLDEVTSWSKQLLGEVEDFIAEAGDESPDMQKHATDKNKNLEIMEDVLYKSLTFTFNPFDEKDNPYTIEEKFRNAGKIKSRYPILYLDGKVLDVLEKPNPQKAKQYVEANLEEYKRLASEFMYWRQNYEKHVKGWSREQAGFKGRHLSNISPLLDILDVFSESQEEYDGWLWFLNRARDAYNENARRSHGLGESIGIEEEDV